MDLEPVVSPLPPLAPTTSRADALSALRRAFAAAGLDTPALDARLLAAAALAVDRTELALQPGAPLGEQGAARLKGFAARRLSREPVARIVGFAEFWSLPFELSAETLVPRPDTESVVETALSLVPDRSVPLRILDLGTGSGCLAIVLLHELPNAFAVGIDVAPGALATARRNAVRNGVPSRVAFAATRWAGALTGQFDLVVSNPPYIRSRDIDDLAPEPRCYDPRLALDGGADGLTAYRAILADAVRLLAPSGVLVLEIGFDQEEEVRQLALRESLTPVLAKRDLGGHIRALAFKLG